MLSGKLTEIRTIFDRNPTLVRLQDTNLPQQQDVIELEAKFGYFMNNRFNSNVPYVHYDRLLNRLRTTQDFIEEDVEESTVTILGDIRRIVTTRSGDENEIVIWQQKRRISDIDIVDYDLRVSANIETTLPPQDNKFLSGKTVIRERTRRSFLMANGLIRVDLTEVMMKAEDKVMRPRYEVEVEYLGTQDNLNVFVEQVDYIFKLLRGTNIIYTNQSKSQLIRDTVKILGGERNDMIDKNVLVEARNIKRRDLVYGGIVGNTKLLDNRVLSTPRRKEHPESGTNYMITFKADGLRKMLIIHSTGIWLVYPPFEFNLVLDLSLNVPQLNKLLTVFNGTILDGELVVPKSGEKASYWYLGFDCLAFKGKSIQQQSYIARETVVNALANAIKTPILTIDTKDTEEIKTPDDFFRLVRKFLDRRDELEYAEDGLMFIPIDTCYNPKSQQYKLYDRSLTNIPDICKWKEGVDITIDFAIKWSVGGKIEPHSFDENTNSMVPFRGDTINPFTSDMIDHANPLTLNKPSNLIVEYEWVKLPQLKPNDPSGIFRPRRIRYDKTGPNKLAIALDDWEDIMNPITEEDIRGDTLTMTFSYHNRIKKSLYNMIASNPDYNPKVKFSKRTVGVNILDIGSGNGGDAAKWIRLTDRDDPTNTGFVVAVEPNSNNRTKLVSRINTFNMQNKVKVVPTGGEDTIAITDAVRSHIPGGKVDVVTLMLSMSFFWASSSHLDSLVNTIVTNLKPGGKIVFLTIDGDTVEQIFEPALGGPVITDLTLSTSKLHLYPPIPSTTDITYGRPLDFILPDTIVGHQREYIVLIDEFSSRLKQYGINLYEIYRAEGEKLLSRDNSLFSSMYSYGYYVNDDKHLLEQIDQSPINIQLPNIPEIIISSPPQMNIPAISTPQAVTQQLSPPKSPVVPTLPPVPIPTPTPVIPTIPIIQNIPTTLTVTAPVKMSKYQIERNQLEWLSVSYTDRNGRITNGPARNDDTYAPLTCTWYNDLVRIATIGEGSCFIHAVLKGFYKTYQNNNSASTRLDIAAIIRRDLAVTLGTENPLYPGHTYWETSARGAFPRMVMQQINDETLIRELGVDYSLAGLQRLFNSTSQLGDEVYTFVSDVFNIDIYVLRATRNDLYPHYHTRRPGMLRNGVVIIGNMYHYEVLAVNKEDGLQTVFPPGDPFLDALTDLFIGDGDFNDIINAVPYNPDEAFAADFVDAFTTAAGLAIPDVINEIFPPSDPFMIALNRTYPLIQTLAQQRIRDLLTPDGGLIENPVMTKLDNILNILEQSGYSNQQVIKIREIVQHRLDPDIPQDLNSILASALTDGLLDQQTVEDINNIEATLQ